MNTYNCSAMWDTRNFNNIHLRAADEKEVKAEGERDGTERGKVAYLFSLVPQHPSNPVVSTEVHSRLEQVGHSLAPTNHFPLSTHPIFKPVNMLILHTVMLDTSTYVSIY